MKTKTDVRNKKDFIRILLILYKFYKDQTTIRDKHTLATDIFGLGMYIAHGSCCVYHQSREGA